MLERESNWSSSLIFTVGFVLTTIEALIEMLDSTRTADEIKSKQSEAELLTCSWKPALTRLGAQATRMSGQLPLVSFHILKLCSLGMQNDCWSKEKLDEHASK